jgi:sigma-B regulation protein RsbU (phosphoserine phosphatase)
MNELTQSQNIGRKFIKISIQYKILLVLIGLVALAVGLFLYFALDLFYQDKTAYVFENSMSNAISISNQIDQKVKHRFESIKLIADLIHAKTDDKIIQNYFESNNEFILFQRFTQKSDHSLIKDITLFNNKLLKKHQREPHEFLISFSSIPEFHILKKRKIHFNILDKISPKLVELSFYYEKLNEIYTAYFELDDLTQVLEVGQVYHSYLINTAGEIILDSKPSQDNKINFVGLIGEGQFQGVKDTLINNTEYLVAFQKISNLDMWVISSLTKEKAFEVAHTLKKRSIAFAVAIIGLSLIIGVLLSTSLTKPINTLLEGTLEVSKGNFKNQINVSTKDELGILADSFNFMSNEIIKYMDEVKEKVRMEDELAVAQLVQSSFFPARDFKNGSFLIAGHYQSASECGGDWWGSIKIKDKSLLFIGDATGHGVPAALITATANCVVNLLTFMSQHNPDLLQNPAAILTILNHTIHQIGGKILMTFFVGIFDEKTGELKYSNASHNPPFLYHYSDNAPSKSDISVLMDVNGPRLGHEKNPDYENATTFIKDNDVLLLFTDGIIEAENPENKQWGERKFIKSFLSYVQSEPRVIVDSILKDALEFYDGTPPNDDVTLIAAKKEKA